MVRVKQFVWFKTIKSDWSKLILSFKLLSGQILGLDHITKHPLPHFPEFIGLLG